MTDWVARPRPDARRLGRRAADRLEVQARLPATVVMLLTGLGALYLAWAQFRAAAGQVTLAQVAGQLAIALHIQLS
jgi:hypothetical protein